MAAMDGSQSAHSEPMMMVPASKFPYRWRSRKTHPERWGQFCRIVPRASVQRHADGTAAAWSFGSSANSTLVEFEDGEQVITTRGSIRRRVL